MPAPVKSTRSFEDTLGAVLGHPVRVRCFVAFNERTTSAAQLCRAWGIPKDQHWRVTHHVRALARLGIIEEVSKRPVRGAFERFYRATARPIVWTEEFSRLSYAEREGFTRYILQLIVTDATLAIDQKVFDQRCNRSMFRFPMVVDEEGFAEMEAEEKATYERRVAIAARTAARNADRVSRGERRDEINIRSVTMFHEAGSGGGALADPPPESDEFDASDPTKAVVEHASAAALELTLPEVLKHPVRVRCFVVLNERVASPNQLTRAWGLRDVKLVSHHVQRLEALGLVEEVSSRPGPRGTTERFYRAIKCPILYTDEFAALSYEERDSFTRYILGLVVTDASLAVEQKIFDLRPSRAIIRMPMNVDELGFDEMLVEELASYERRKRIKVESEARIEVRLNRGEAPLEIPIRSVTMVHEAASGGGALADPPPEVLELDALDSMCGSDNP